MWSVWSCLGAAAAAAGLGWAGLPTHYIESVKSCKWHGSMTPPGRRAAGEMFMETGTFPFPPTSLLLGSFSSRDRSKRRTLGGEEARIQTAVEGVWDM